MIDHSTRASTAFNGFHVDWADSPETEHQSLVLMVRELCGPDYGLSSPDFAHTLIRAGSTRFMASSKAGEQFPVGVFRVTPNYDPLMHGNIAEDVARYIEAGNRIADVGAYFAIRGQARAGCFLGLFRQLVRHMRSTELDGIYIQTQPKDVARYCSLGFVPCSPVFSVPGWSTTWVAMVLSIATIDEFFGVEPTRRGPPALAIQTEVLNTSVLRSLFMGG